MGEHYLSRLFHPSSVAVFGASDREDSVGGKIFRNLRGTFTGELFPVNPNRDEVQGERSWAALGELNVPVDLAVIATPAATIPGIMEQCGEHEVPYAVILSGGFREMGDAGAALEQRVAETARRYGIRFIGPNCLGLMIPKIGLNATFNEGGAAPGNLALVSQSGALCSAILDWASVNRIGFSALVSTGSAADLDFGEILDFLVSDPGTKSILLYIEGIRNARSFMSALRAAARLKPVVAIKVGRHEAGSHAARSHTGALVGSDAAFDAALKRGGVVRVGSIGQLFAVARALTWEFRPAGNRLAVVTNGGGPGVMATDRAADLGIPLAHLADNTLSCLGTMLSPLWSRGNPVDLIGSASPTDYRGAVTACLADPNVNGALVIFTPHASSRPLDAARAVIERAVAQKKPVLAVWMGGARIEESHNAFIEARVPAFRTPEAAVEAFSYLSTYYENQRLLLQTASARPFEPPEEHPDVEGARLVIESVLDERRKVLSETESKAVLRAFRIPVAPSFVARSPNEALTIAEELGLPVAMKVHSPDITHKTDVEGVLLDVAGAHDVRRGYRAILERVAKNAPEARLDGVLIEPMARKPHGRELMIGVTNDTIFGPVVSFGAGGTTVEVLGDHAVAIPPLNRYLVRDLIGRTRVARLLARFRNMAAVDMAALENVLLRVSEMVCELPWLREMDINPLIADADGVEVADARIIVDYHTPETDPYAHMAIYPYPTGLVEDWQLNDGTDVTIRPIRPEDAEIEQDFVRSLSDEAKYFRFMHTLQELTPEMLIRFTQIDYDREMALIAVVRSNGTDTEIGVCRYVIGPDGDSCEFALVVADDWRHKGIAHKLMKSLIDAAQAKGLTTMEGEVLAENRQMLTLVRNLGFVVRTDPDDLSIRYVQRAL